MKTRREKKKKKKDKIYREDQAMANEAFDLPLAKRQKVVTEKTSYSGAPEGSRIFTPFRVRPFHFGVYIYTIG